MRFIVAFFSFMLVFSIFPSKALSQRPQVRVLVLPFDMHSTEDITRARRNAMEALAASLDSSGAEIAGIELLKGLVLEKGVVRFDEESAFSVSGDALADFAILGSLSKLGRRFDLNLRVLDVKGRKVLTFLSRTAESEEELLKKLGDEGRPLFEKMAGSLRERPALKAGKIDRINITGNRRVDGEAISGKLVSKVGESFSPDDVKEDIRNIFAMGYFDDVTVDFSETALGRVLTYTVKEKPFIKKIEIAGNKELTEEKIREALLIKENTVLDRVLLKENAEKVKKLYEEEGYYLAKVAPEVTSDGVDAAVVFRIEEGEEVRVKRITILGNKNFSDKEIKGVMNTAEAGLLSFLTGSGKFNEFIFQNDLALIISHYFDNGYIRADILEHRVLLSEDRKWFHITIALAEGEQFRVGAIDVKGDILTTKDEILEKLRIRSGEVFNRSRLGKGIDAVADIYGDKGYANADINPITRVDPEKRTIDLTIDIRKNELVYIERIDITGNVRTRDKVIRRELELGEGDLFSSSSLKRSRNNIRRLGYFEDAAISQTQGSTPSQMKLDISVKERPTGSISLGMGYSSVDKLIGTAAISQSNLFGTGIKLDLSGTISSSSSRYVLGFTEPWLFDKPLSAGFDVYNTGREYPDFDMNKNGFDLRFGVPVYKLYTRGYLTYKYEEVEISDVSDLASTFIKSQEGKTKSSSIKALLRHDTRDDAFFPTEGSVISLSTEYAGGILGGDSYFVKYETDAVKFFPLPLDTTFSTRGALGYVHSFSGRTVPIYEKYFLGGINTLRGFQTREVGPRDPVTKEFIGGETMLVVNLEFLFPLFSERGLKGLVFFDMGNAYDGPIDFGDLRTSAGVGIRWFSPLGPLRLEWGYNLNRREDENASQWEFAVGTAF